jgi:hypothetical protein
MNIIAVSSLSDKLIASGVGAAVAGILCILAIKCRVIPDLPIKWGISITGISVGLILLTIGLLQK